MLNLSERTLKAHIDTHRCIDGKGSMRRLTSISFLSHSCHSPWKPPVHSPGFCTGLYNTLALASPNSVTTYYYLIHKFFGLSVVKEYRIRIHKCWQCHY